MLLTKTNPFLKKPYIYTSGRDDVVANEKPVLSFSKDTGFLYINHACYFINPKMEQEFGLESRELVICEKKMQAIADQTIVSDYEQLEQVAFQRKNTKKFLDFDSEVLDHIVRLPIEQRAEFLGRYGILIDEKGLLDTSDEGQCELVIDLLCCRSCLDVFGRLSTGNNITPR